MNHGFDDGTLIALGAASRQQAIALWGAVKNLEGAPTWRVAVNACLRRRNLEAACALAPFMDPAFAGVEHQGERLAQYFPHRIMGLVDPQHEDDACAIDALMDSGLVGPGAHHWHDGDIYTPLAWLLSHDYDAAAQSYLARGVVAATDLDNSLYCLLRPDPILGTNELQFLEFSPCHRDWIERVLDHMGSNPDTNGRIVGRVIGCAQRFGSQHLDLARRLMGQGMEAWTQGGPSCLMVRWMQNGGDHGFALDGAHGAQVAPETMAQIIKMICVPSIYDEDSAMPRLASMLEEGHIQLEEPMDRAAMIQCAHLLLRAGLVLEMEQAMIEQCWARLERVLRSSTQFPEVIGPWCGALGQVHKDTNAARINQADFARSLERAMAKAEDISLDLLTKKAIATAARTPRL